MRASSRKFRLSASDLSNHLACHHLTSLDLAVAIGSRLAPRWHSPDARVLQERGMEHENAYLAHLEAQGVSILNLRDIDHSDSAVVEARNAMENGVEAIAQGTLADGRWFGRADVLPASRAGPADWAAGRDEVYDCKLACETKAATILQLSLYSELLEVQGLLPESMFVVPPGSGFPG